LEPSRDGVISHNPLVSGKKKCKVNMDWFTIIGFAPITSWHQEASQQILQRSSKARLMRLIRTRNDTNQFLPLLWTGRQRPQLKKSTLQKHQSAKLRSGAGCGRLVTTWFGWSENHKNTLKVIQNFRDYSQEKLWEPACLQQNMKNTPQKLWWV
jgi:hypothetical protein